MNDLQLARILRNRAKRVKGFVVVSGIAGNTSEVLFRVSVDSGAIFQVAITVYKDAP